MINMTFVEVLLEDCDSVYFSYISEDKKYCSGLFTITMKQYYFRLKKDVESQQTTIRIIDGNGERLFEGEMFSFLNWWYDWRKTND